MKNTAQAECIWHEINHYRHYYDLQTAALIDHPELGSVVAADWHEINHELQRAERITSYQRR